MQLTIFTMDLKLMIDYPVWVIGGEVLAEIGGKSTNIAWLYGKLRSGYKVVDIGIATARTIRSSKLYHGKNYDNHLEE